MASFAPPPTSRPSMGGLPPQAIAARRQAMAGRGGPPMPQRPGMGNPGGLQQPGGPQQMKGAPGAVNPYRNPKGVTPELLAQMARRRLGG